MLSGPTRGIYLESTSSFGSLLKSEQADHQFFKEDLSLVIRSCRSSMLYVESFVTPTNSSGRTPLPRTKSA